MALVECAELIEVEEDRGHRRSVGRIETRSPAAFMPARRPSERANLQSRTRFWTGSADRAASASGDRILVT